MQAEIYWFIWTIGNLIVMWLLLLVDAACEFMFSLCDMLYDCKFSNVTV